MRVRATGSPGVTTVNAVQTTVKWEGVRYEGRTIKRRSLAVIGQVKIIKYTQRYGLQKEDRVKER